jgi:hypothetical protein
MVCQCLHISTLSLLGTYNLPAASTLEGFSSETVQQPLNTDAE